jgi:hypothetical protein
MGRRSRRGKPTGDSQGEQGREPEKIFSFDGTTEHSTILSTARQKRKLI